MSRRDVDATRRDALVATAPRANLVGDGQERPTTLRCAAARLPPRRRRGRGWCRARRSRARSARSRLALVRAAQACEGSAGSSPRHATVRLPDRHRRRPDDGEPFVRPLPRWLGSDEQYLEAGKSRWGSKFTRRRQDRPHVRRRRRQAPQDAPPRPQRRRTASVPRLRASRSRGTAGTRGGSSSPTASSPPAPATTRTRSATTWARTCPSTRTRRGASPCSTARSRRCSRARSRTGSTRTPRSPTASGKTRSRCAGHVQDADDLRQAHRPSKCRSRTYFTDLLVPLRSGATQYVDWIHPIDDYFEACSSGHAAQRRCHLARVRRRPPHRRPLAGRRPPRAALHPRGVQGVRAVEALGARPVHPHLRRVGRLLRPREAADPGRRARQRRPRERLRARGLPRADDPVVAVRAAELRRPPGVRPHVDAPLPRVALPGRAPRGAGWRSTWNLTLRDRHANNIAAVARVPPIPNPELGYELDESRSGPTARAARRTRSTATIRPCPRASIPTRSSSPTSSGRCSSRSTRRSGTPPGSTSRTA